METIASLLEDENEIPMRSSDSRSNPGGGL